MPDTPKRSLFQIKYSMADQPRTSYVCAFTEGDAVAFLGVPDGSGMTITRMAYPVELVGVDEAHLPFAPAKALVGPPPPPEPLTDQELRELRDILRGKISLGPTQVQPDPLVKG